MSDLKRTDMGLYVLTADTSLSREVEHLGTFETPKNLRDIRAIAPLIPEGGVVIDAGACIGDHTCIYSQIVGAFGHIYAYEPHPVSYQALFNNTARLRNVTTLPYALADYVGHSSLRITPNVGASFVSPYPDEFPIVDIEMVTLDKDILPVVTRCDFIHLDAEGMEPAILRGAKALIEKFHPVLLVEVTHEWLARYGSSESELLALIHALGYATHSLQPIPPGTVAEQYDLLAVPTTMQVEFVRQPIDTVVELPHTVASA